MKGPLKKLHAAARRFWYQRGYYRTQVLPATVPLYPLAYMPTGMTVHATGNPAIRTIEQLATAAECALLLELAGAGLRDGSAVVYGEAVQDARLLPLISRCAALTGARMEYVDAVEVRCLHTGQASVPLTLPRDRIRTALVYLNDPGADAATVFAHADVSVTPAAGRGICWVNTDAAGRPRADLAAVDRPPTGNTEKWVALLGFRPYATLPVAALPPLQARPGVALTPAATLPPGAWLPAPG